MDSRGEKVGEEGIEYSKVGKCILSSLGVGETGLKRSDAKSPRRYL